MGNEWVMVWCGVVWSLGLEGEGEGEQVEGQGV